MTWRPAYSLVVFHNQLKAGAPAAKPPATPEDAWGLVGDAVHSPTSDHAPKDFPGWGNDIVTAADFPNAPALGLDAHKVLDDLRRARDNRVKYAISNDQIFSSYATASRRAWEWGPYNPNDPKRDKHFEHGHLSVVGDARADDRRPWPTIGSTSAQAADQEQWKDEDDMGFTIEDKTNVPVQGGAAWRTSYLQITNDTSFGDPTGPDYALRIAAKPYSKDWVFVNDTDRTGGVVKDGVVRLKNGETMSWKLPPDTRAVSVRREDIEGVSYDGPLAGTIERV
jgi:hypothetical protein